MKTKSFLLALSIASVALAQDPPRLSRLYHYDVPPDSAPEFYAVQRETADIYKANKSPITRLAWTSLTGPQMFYQMVPIASLDKLMEPTWLSKQGEEMPRQARQARLRKATGAMKVQITTMIDAATWDPTPKDAPDPFATVAIYSIKPGKVQDFLAVLTELKALAQKMGKAKSHYVNRVAYGGDAYEFHVFTGYASLADIVGQAAFRAAMGEAAYTAYIQKMGGIVNSLQREIVRYRPEFSHLPAN